MKRDKNKKAAISKNPNKADAILADIRQTPLRKSEKGAAYVALAEVYLDTMNNVREKYRKSLEETIRDWNRLDNLGKSFEDKLSLAKIRATLKK